MPSWIDDELRTADLGDPRLDRRFALLLERLSARPTVSIPAACNGRAEVEAAYRFFDNDRVGVANLLAPHADATVLRVRPQPLVLQIQDTTELDLTRKQERVGGPLNDAHRGGLFVHTQLVVTPHGVPLGIVAAELWARDAATFGTSNRTRKRKAIEAKESQRWLTGYRRACWLAEQAPDTVVISVADSEGDIYEYFLEAARRVGPKAHWLVRACQDRRLCDPAATKLWAAVAAAPVLGQLTVEARARAKTTGDDRPRRQARTARQATVTVQAQTVTLSAPQRKGQQLPDLTVQALLVREVNPPAGEAAIEWLLLTDLPCATWAEAVPVIGYYCQRWQAEVYHRVLKSGCTVEDVQVETTERLQACVAVYLIVAWRVLFVTMLGRECPDLPCDVVFSAEEWQAVYTVVQQRPAPARPPRLEEMVGLLARLGGYLGRKGDGPPGPKTVWIGLQRMRDFATGWLLFGSGIKKATG
jgi:Transposase DNA-binding/Transposase Tn5 dimerisation domain